MSFFEKILDKIKPKKEIKETHGFQTGDTISVTVDTSVGSTSNSGFVTYTGTGGDTITVPNSGLKPESVWIKDSGTSWTIFDSHEVDLEGFDKEMRENNPSLQKAYERYKTVRKLCK